MVRRYLVSSQGNHKDGLTSALSLYRECGGGKHLYFHIPSYNQLDVGNVVFEVLGKQTCKDLRDGQRVRLSPAHSISVITDLNFNLRHTNDVVMSVYPTSKGIALINDTKNAHAIIVVPWTMNEDVLKWQRAWTPTIIGDTTMTIEQLDLDPVIMDFLRRLTESANLSTGLVHPSDRNSAIELFQILRNDGITYDSAMVEAWAIKNGWNAGGAKDLALVAKEIADGKKLRTSNNGSSWKTNILDEIRTELDK